MVQNDEVLVTILNNRLDFELARDQHWYRIPVSSQKKWLAKRWPPKWLAFYHTKKLTPEAHGIFYYAEVIYIRIALRGELFPNEPHNSPKANRRYFQIFLSPLKKLPKPILSRRWRRIVFIPTTWQKFINAIEINDLYDESPLEDRLWAELKRMNVPAERQLFVRVKDRDYALDFAVYCSRGTIDIETDGDKWHSDKARIPKDNMRDNDLKTEGWRVLRFNTYHIREEMASYCLPIIAKNINRLGGIEEGKVIPRSVSTDDPTQGFQPSLFDVINDDD